MTPPSPTMIPGPTTALIAEDEPLLREALERLLKLTWPELVVVARARNGREAINRFEALRPTVCFLDIHMPGLSGIEAARRIGHRAHLVFVTAYDQYAVQAFAEGVLDYLVKPVDAARLTRTVLRLQQRLRDAQPALNTEALLQALAAQLERRSAPAPLPLRWIRASVGQTVSLIPVADIDYLRAGEKYTSVAWHDQAGAARDAVIRTSLKDLIAQLDAAQFAQVHRSVVVNLSSVARVVRGDNETADIHLKGRGEVLPVSRSYLHLFRQM
ncbi:MAG: LytTR family DNA-binding domain-containing protein [Gammaproteobacteria bacterium]